MKKTVIISGSLKKSAVSEQFNELSKHFIANNYRVIFIADHKKKIVSNTDGIEYLTWPSFRPTKLADFIYACKVIYKNRPIATISNFSSVNIMLIVSWLFRVPHRITLFHTSPLQSSTMGIRKVKTYRKKVIYYFSTLIMPVSNGLKEEFVATYGKIHGRFKVFNLGIRKRDVRLVEKRGMLFVGRLEKIKGVKYLIKAMPEVIEKVPSASLDLYGDGSCRGEYENFIKELKLEKHLFLKGFVEYKLVLEKFQNYKMFVLPSLGEGFGLSALEAISVGLPVVASNVGGIPDIVKDGVNGYLVEKEDEKELAEKIISLLSDEKKLNVFSSNSKKLFDENFELKRIVEKQFMFFDGLFQDRSN